MSIDPSELRILADRYRTGQLDYDAYQQQRSELLSRLEQGEAIKRKPARQAFAEIAVDQNELTQPIAIQDIHAARKSRTPWLIVLALLLLVAAGGVYLLMLNKPVSDTATQSASTDLPPTVFEQFLETPQWDVDSLSALKNSWAVLPQLRRNALKQKPWFRRLTDLLQQQENQLAALSDIGDEQAATLLTELNGLTQTLSK